MVLGYIMPPFHSLILPLTVTGLSVLLYSLFLFLCICMLYLFFFFAVVIRIFILVSIDANIEAGFMFLMNRPVMTHKVTFNTKVKLREVVGF